MATAAMAVQMDNFAHDGRPWVSSCSSVSQHAACTASPGSLSSSTRASSPGGNSTTSSSQEQAATPEQQAKQASILAQRRKPRELVLNDLGVEVQRSPCPLNRPPSLPSVSSTPPPPAHEACIESSQDAVPLSCCYNDNTPPPPAHEPTVETPQPSPRGTGVAPMASKPMKSVEGLPEKSDSPPEGYSLVATSPASGPRSKATLGGDASQRSPAAPISSRGDASQRSPMTLGSTGYSQRKALPPLPRSQPWGDASQRSPMTFGYSQRAAAAPPVGSAWASAAASIAATRAAAATPEAPPKQQSQPPTPTNTQLSIVATSPAGASPVLTQKGDASQRGLADSSKLIGMSLMTTSPTTVNSTSLGSEGGLPTCWPSILSGATSMSNEDLAVKLRAAAPEVYED